MAHYILADGERPFADRDAATVKSKLLAAELGSSVQVNVVSLAEGGFAVRCERRAAANTQTLPTPPTSQAAASPMLSAARNTSAPAATAQVSAPTQYPDRFELAPAPRAFLSQQFFGLVGLALILQPHLFFKATSLQIPQGRAGVIALTMVFFAGIALAAISFSRFLWVYLANSYLVDEAGVQQIQWYWERSRLRRRAPRLNFSNLRSVDIEQTVMQMLLGVGTLKLASGGTDGYEVQLRFVRSPRKLQAEFQRRMPLPPLPIPRNTRAALV